MVAMICGCSPPISSATAAESIHFRLSMPALSLSRRMRSIRPAGLVVAQGPGEHVAQVLVGGGADIGLPLGLVAKLAQHIGHLFARHVG